MKMPTLEVRVLISSIEVQAMGIVIRDKSFHKPSIPTKTVLKIKKTPINKSQELQPQPVPLFWSLYQLTNNTNQNIFLPLRFLELFPQPLDFPS